MKIILWNDKGLGSAEQRMPVKEVIHKSKANIVLLQKTKISIMNNVLASGHGVVDMSNVLEKLSSLWLMWNTIKRHQQRCGLVGYQFQLLYRNQEIKKMRIIASVYGSNYYQLHNIFLQSLIQFVPDILGLGASRRISMWSHSLEKG